MGGGIKKFIARQRAALEAKYLIKGTGKSVRIFMPMYPAPNPNTVTCLLGLVQGFAGLGTPYDTKLSFKTGSLISHLRSESGREFIEDDESVGMLCIDADAIWPNGSALDAAGKAVQGFNALDRLMSRDKDIVGALCTNRSIPTVIAAGWFDGEGSLSRVEDENQGHPLNSTPFQVDWIGMHFTYVTRRAALKIANHIDQHAFLFEPESRLWDRPEKMAEVGRLLEAYKAGTHDVDDVVATLKRLFNASGYYPEDVAFCRRAKDAGVEVWVDPSFDVGHFGEYRYTRMDWIGQKMLAREAETAAAEA